MSEPVVHGSVSEAERDAYAARGIALVDLSASLNPYGPHPRVARAARAATIERYPESDARELREAYACATGLSPDSVLAGNGSSELIYLAARAASAANGTGLIVGPTFGEYARAIRASGMTVEAWAAHAPGFGICVDEIVALIQRLRPRIVFVCNPNNPTGVLFDELEIERLTAAARESDGWTVVDEAYMDFAGPASRTPPTPSRVILRSLTKLHSMPGLRLGFAVAEPAIIDGLAALQPPWSVSAPAQAAGLQALGEQEFAARSVRRIGLGRSRLTKCLGMAGFDVNDSSANFLLVRVGNAAAFRLRLMERGFVVRDCTSFGLSEHVRVAIPRTRDLRRLVHAMAGAIEEMRR